MSPVGPEYNRWRIVFWIFGGKDEKRPAWGFYSFQDKHMRYKGFIFPILPLGVRIERERVK